MGRWITAILLAGAALPASASAIVEKPFVARYSANAPGAIWVTGSTLMTCPAAAANCAASRAGTATGAALSNNNYAMVPVDTDADATTFNSSSSTFTPPAGSEVLFAGLYFGGRTSAGSGGLPAPSAAARGTALLRTPGSALYAPVTGEVADSTAVAGAYTAFADVTAQVRAAGAGRYEVANVQSGTGLDRYAGWTLVVVYRDVTQPLRDLTVFDGLAAIQQGDPPLEIAVSGFVTPATGPRRTSVGIVAYEGDRGSGGDRLSLAGTPLSDAANPENNVFNSSVSFEGTNTTAQRIPPYVNALGFDADRIRADDVLANGATSATLRAATTLDQYLIQVATFTTDLSQPVLELAKSVDQAETGPGGTLRYTLTLRNTGDDDALGVQIQDGDRRFDVGRLAAGASVTQTFDAVAGDLPDGFAIENVATATGTGETAGLPVTATSPAATTIVRRPPVEATVDVTPDVPTAGEIATAEITIESETTVPLTDLEAEVEIPGAGIVEVTGDERGTLEPGAQTVVRVRFRPRDGGTLRPTVTVTAEGLAPLELSLGTIRVQRGRPRLSVSKRAGTSQARRGRTITYRIRVRAARTGATGHDVRVCDRPGRGLKLRTSKPCRTIKTLAPGRSRTIRIKARITASRGVVRNTARIRGVRAAVARVRVIPERASACGAATAHMAC